MLEENFVFVCKEEEEITNKEKIITTTLIDDKVLNNDKEWEINSLIDDSRVLTLLQNEQEGIKLVELRNKLLENVHELHKSAHSYLGLLHFLRSRNNNVQYAYDMVVEDIKWRRKMKVDSIEEVAKECIYFEALQEYMPIKYHGKTKDNRLVIYFSLGSIDANAVFNKVPSEALIYWVIHFYERFRHTLYSQEDPQACYNALVIADVKGISWSLGYCLTANKNRFSELTAVAERHYPETMFATYVINAPSFFKKMWKTFSSFLDTTTSQKIKVFKGKEFEIKLKEIIYNENIPLAYGGSCKCQGIEIDCIPSGGMFDPIVEGMEFVDFNREYVQRHQYEVEVNSGDIIKWDFHTEVHSVRFGVLYGDTTIIDVKKEPSHLGTVSGEIKVEKTGIYSLLWDNSTSRIQKKRLYYKCYVINE